MTQFLALLPILLGGGQDHAQLHPVDAAVYLEIPDASRVAKAYEKAPLVRLFKDERVRKLLSEFGEDLDGEAVVLESFWQLLGLPEGEQLTREIRTVSVSLTAPDTTARWANPANFDPKGFGLRLVADFSSGTYAQRLAGLVQGLAENTAPDAKTGMHRLTFEGMEGFDVVCGVRDARLVLFGGTAVDGIDKRFDEKGSLTASKLWQSSDEFAENGGTTLFRGMHASSLWDAVELFLQMEGVDFGMPQLPESLDPFAAGQVWQMDLTEGRFVTQRFRPQESGNPAFGVEDLSRSSFDYLPEDVMFAWVGSFDGKSAATGLGNMLPGNDPVSQVLGLLEQKGLSFGRFASNLGPSVSIYAQPVTGLALPTVHVWVELRDVDAFERDLQSFCAALPELLPGSKSGTRDYKVKDATTGERVAIPITTIDLPDSIARPGGFVSLGSPTIAVVGDRLLFGLSSSKIKKELKRVHSEEFGETGLIDRLDVELPEHVRSFHVMDWGRLFAGVWDLVRNLGGMLAGLAGQDLPFDPQALPPSDMFTRFFTPTIDYSTPREDGSLAYHASSFGPELIVLPAIGWLGVMQQRAGLLGVDLPVGSAPAPVRPATPEHRITYDHLESLQSALATFAEEQGGFPRTLGDLRKPTPRFPGGFLFTPRGFATDEHGVPLDGWGASFLYRRFEDGSHRLWSRGPNGVDDGGNADDVHGS